MDSNEVWKSIDGFPNYLVSNLGRVKSLSFNHSGKERILKPSFNHNGYLRISLTNEKGKKTFKVHRLVALAFIPNPDNLPQVNHKDENKQNNNVDNLEWCSPKYNSNYGTGIFRYTSKISIPIIQLTLDGDYVSCYRSSHDAARITGYNQQSINKCCRNELNKTHGYKWLYATDYDGLYEIPLF